MILPIIVKALLLGLSTGLFCIGFCLPLVGPVLLGREKTKLTDTASLLGLFLAGRLVAYLLFGVVFGLVGATLTRVWLVRTYLLPAVYLLLGLLMILYGLATSMPHLGVCRVLNPRLRSPGFLPVLGFLAGINLCPPFLLAITAVVGLGGAFRGLLFFFVFFVATSIYLLPLIFAGLASRFASIRFAGRVSAVVAGGYFIYLGLTILLPPACPPSPPVCNPEPGICNRLAVSRRPPRPRVWQARPGGLT
jgi:sulfite exporter TauE/SafE